MELCSEYWSPFLFPNTCVSSMILEQGHKLKNKEVRSQHKQDILLLRVFRPIVHNSVRHKFTTTVRTCVQCSSVQFSSVLLCLQWYKAFNRASWTYFLVEKCSFCVVTLTSLEDSKKQVSKTSTLTLSSDHRTCTKPTDVWVGAHESSGRCGLVIGSLCSLSAGDAWCEYRMRTLCILWLNSLTNASTPHLSSHNVVGSCYFTAHRLTLAWQLASVQPRITRR